MLNLHEESLQTEPLLILPESSPQLAASIKPADWQQLRHLGAKLPKRVCRPESGPYAMRVGGVVSNLPRIEVASHPTARLIQRFFASSPMQSLFQTLGGTRKPLVIRRAEVMEMEAHHYQGFHRDVEIDPDSQVGVVFCLTPPSLYQGGGVVFEGRLEPIKPEVNSLWVYRANLGYRLCRVEECEQPRLLIRVLLGESDQVSAKLPVHTRDFLLPFTQSSPAPVHVC